jgi:hypothetical protein
MPYKDRLRRLSALIRIGLSQSDECWSTDMAPAALRKAIDDIMQELASLGGQKPRADLIEVLRYKALKAEYEYSFGVIDGTAADELAHYLEFVRLPKALSAWSERKLRFLGRHDPRPLLRQKVWALMAMAFYYEYAHKGNVNGAIQMLEKLDEVVRNELAAMESAYAPNGTLARLYEFLAQCHRTARNYDTAQRYFMESERYGERRLRAKIEDHSVTPAQRLYEYQFSVISTARILGGVGRLATLQGALARAEVVLRCARTLLRPTGQVVMKNVAATYLAIVERRRCDPVEDRAAWQERLVRLKTLYFRFNPEDPDAPPPARVPDKTPPVERWIDQDGARRTAQELARAYLDEAEAQGRNVRGEALHNADTWLSKLDALADRRLNGGHESNERFRVHLLRASWYVLNHPPDFREALKLLKRAESIFKKHDEYSLDLVGFDSANLELTKLVVLGARF